MIHRAIVWAKAHPNAACYLAGIALMLIPALLTVGAHHVCREFGASLNAGPAPLLVLMQLMQSPLWGWANIAVAGIGLGLIIRAIGWRELKSTRVG